MLVLQHLKFCGKRGVKAAIKQADRGRYQSMKKRRQPLLAWVNDRVIYLNVEFRISYFAEPLQPGLAREVTTPPGIKTAAFHFFADWTQTAHGTKLKTLATKQKTLLAVRVWVCTYQTVAPNDSVSNEIGGGRQQQLRERTQRCSGAHKLYGKNKK